MTVVEIILALFVPPISVLLKRGVGRQFLIAILLTLLGHLPGVVYALVIATESG